MKDKRNRLALAWPYAVYSDPALAASILQAAAASAGVGALPGLAAAFNPYSLPPYYHHPHQTAPPPPASMMPRYTYPGVPPHMHPALHRPAPAPAAPASPLRAPLGSPPTSFMRPMPGAMRTSPLSSPMTSPMTSPLCPLRLGSRLSPRMSPTHSEHSSGTVSPTAMSPTAVSPTGVDDDCDGSGSCRCGIVNCIASSASSSATTLTPSSTVSRLLLSSPAPALAPLPLRYSPGARPSPSITASGLTVLHEPEPPKLFQPYKTETA